MQVFGCVTAGVTACAIPSLTIIFNTMYITWVVWDIEGSEEFGEWFAGLTRSEKISVAGKIDLLEEKGPALGRQHADTLRGSKLPNLKELIIQHAGDAFRVIFAFDPRRTAILLVGGRKSGNKWYKTSIPGAERIYERYIEEIRKEGLI
jgi:hypothetical protein